MSGVSSLQEPTANRLPLLEQELNDFTYIVSHDLAASFRHITGFSDLLARNFSDVSSQDQGVYVGLIRDAAQKCECMLDKLHAYSRVLNAPMNLEDCDVTRVLDVVRLRLSASIKECGAQFDIGQLDWVRADSELLTDALAHILDNAIKFRRTGVAPRIAIGQVPDQAEWKMRIRDNGIGVTEGEQERHFTMFHRGHAEGAYPGTGAGLTIARRILRRHEGDARFVECHDGACVEIVLPRGGLAYGGEGK